MSIDRLLPSQVTVLSAFAGYGKTRRLAPLRPLPGTVWLDARSGHDPGDEIGSALDGRACRVLVIDDAHLFDPSGAAVHLLRRAVERPRPSTRLAIAGRPPLPIPIATCLARGDATELTEADLALGPDSVAELLDRALGGPAARLAPRLHELASGWPALVAIAIAHLSHRPAEEWPGIVERMFTTGGAALGFVVEQVLGGLDAGERAVLALVAHGSTTGSGDVSERLVAACGIDPSGAALAGLVGSRLLVPSGVTAAPLVVPPLIRDAVRHAMPLDPADVQDQLRRAARHWVGTGQLDDAVELLRRLGDTETIAAVLTDQGQRMLRDGQVDTLVAAARAIPESSRPAEITMALGQALQVRGDYEGALGCYETLAAGASEVAAGLAWRMGVIHYLNGEPRRAEECYRRGRLAAEDTADEALLLGWMASAEWMTGNLAGCAELAHRSYAAAHRCGDPAALATAHVALALHAGLVGNRRELAEHYERAIDHAEQAGDRLLLVRARSNLAAHRVTEGRLDQALTELELAAKLAAQAGFAAFEALGHVNSGEALIHLARLDEATAEYESAKSIYERMGSRKIAYALNGLGDVHRARGSLRLARAAYSEALTVTEKGEDLQAYVPALCGLARVIASTEPERAEGLAREAAEQPGPGQAQAWITLGWLALGRGFGADRETALDLAGRAESIAAQHRDWSAFAESQELAALAGDPSDALRLLREAGQSWSQAGSTLGMLRLRYARGRLRQQPGAKPDPDAEDAARLLACSGVALENPPAAGLLAALPPLAPVWIQVTTLGRFAITRGNEAVDLTRWQSKKARTLFKILVSRLGKPVPRDELMDLLWPDEEPERLSNRFAVAATALRRCLDPGHAMPANWVVVSTSSALSLDVEHADVDVAHFLADVASGLRLAGAGRDREAALVLAAAANRYTGDFLAEDPYDEWAMPLRDHAANLMLRCLCTLGELALRAGDQGAAADYANRALEREPNDERAQWVRTEVETRVRVGKQD